MTHPKRVFATLRCTVALVLTSVGGLVLICAPVDAAPDCSGVCFYASPSGGGTACSLATPCSLSTAITRVAANAPTAMSDLNLVLRGGTYSLSQTISLGPEHVPVAP